MEGAKVYVQDSGGAWQKATVLAALGSGRHRVQVEPWEDGGSDAGAAGAVSSNQTVEVDASKMEGGSLPFQNSGMPDNGFPNMTALDHLHEAALLHNLRRRFFAGGSPYTYTADIVIAVNPYRWYPHLYTEEQRKEYLVFDKSKLPPHAYAASSAAYSGLQETKTDQSILVSGESGAGKTETVKILMAHLALIASSDDSSHIQRIVESNPLLESFGNAQTVRNDNSSRFGKFIELQLNVKHRLVGSKCRTYLLEKSRVVGQDAGERNYHIFYQMLAADAETRASYGLGDNSYTRDSMRYTRLGASKTDKIEGMSDEQRFVGTKAALALVGVSGTSLAQLLSALAGVLFFGQIEFEKKAGEDDAATLSGGSATDVAQVAATLQVDVPAVEQALTKRSLKTRHETIVTHLSGSAAAMTRDAVAKELYSRIFDWLVGRICEATTATSGDCKHFVGMLDIFGFESFAINRFEQLCINYANEKLQQKFTMDVFKAVQQEYSDEGIPWDRIEFKDNAPVLALIESKLGIIAMLNEECVRPKGSDQNFVSKLATVHKADPAFSTPKLGAMKELQFAVRHYAGAVTYTASEWLDRNKDTLSDDVVNLLRGSGNALVAEVFREQPMPDGGSGGDAKGKAASNTVATKFRNSLADLMDTVNRTATQYVRCIKPNKTKSPVEMDNMMVVEQLRCAGVIEAIRISRAGFPARMPLKEFAQRFGTLARAAVGVGFARAGDAARGGGGKMPAATVSAVVAISPSTDGGVACRAMLAALSPSDTESYEVGRTRVYFKSGVLELLEERRAMLQQIAAVEVGRRMRGRHTRHRFLRTRAAALRLQAAQRMHHQNAVYLSIRTAAIIFQAHRRAVLAKREFAILRQERCATRIQAFQRRRVAMEALRRSREAAVRLQSAVRSRACRRQYLIDLAEHKEQAKLENQVRALQARLEAQEKAARSANVSEPPAEVLEALQALKAENAKLRADNEKQRTEIASLRRENQELRASQAARGEHLDAIARSRKPPVVAERATRSSAPLEPRTNSSAHESVKAAASESQGVLFDCEGEGGQQDSGFRVYEPLSEFWEDVPSAVLPLLKTGSEVHIKFGKNILMVDEGNRNLAWRRWMTSAAQGYMRSMAFFLERRGDVGVDASPGVARDDCSLGLAFTLRSALTGRYVQPGGMLDRNSMKVAGNKIEEATVFTIAPLPPGVLNSGSSQEDSNTEEYLCALRVVGENKMLRLRSDGTVCVSVVTHLDADVRYDRMAASIEYLPPRDSYTITMNEAPIGISISKEQPPRVVGFRQGPRGPGGAFAPGPAERTGRVHVGDHVTSVNGQDVSGIVGGDIAAMVLSKVPVSLGFAVAGGDSAGVETNANATARDSIRRRSLFTTFSKKSTVKSSAAKGQPRPKSEDIVDI